MSRSTRTLIALVALVAAGCSSDGGTAASGEPADGAAMGLADYALKLAEWQCDDLAACCEATQRSVDRDNCVAIKQQAAIRSVTYLASHHGGVFDAAMAATCVAKLQETPADCGDRDFPRECYDLDDGLQEIGEACSTTSTCRGGLRGDVRCIGGRCTPRIAAGEACPNPLPDGESRCSVCRPNARCLEAEDGNHFCYGYERRRGVAGDPCLREFLPPGDPKEVSIIATCEEEDGLYCSSTGTCEPFVAIGGACTSSRKCGPGARCADGACKHGLLVGEACHSSYNECGPGLTCFWTDVACTEWDAELKKCRSYALLGGRCAVPGGEGDPCDDDHQFVRCAEGLSCEPTYPGSRDRHCAAPPDRCTLGIDRVTRQSR